ncbi:CDP-glucose 4,6-dehydratase [Clostridium sp. JS66]|uniref:CDP-glucose 4,6-dehydratase n=1 Tax=Clostridium sp. JS66 TaxID=3064705 RepID=UPI00298D8161|nr:CDP-glucose 4,6-dehydratase [Clostridium sp. JS66]WPC41059.1 CDP-glucose 4,6-dehydratase [Clostridium sp. JS66]
MNSFWKNKKVLITGHTGFKGSWLTLWLLNLGAKVIGYSLEPQSKPNMFQVIKMKNEIHSIYGDICNEEYIHRIIENYEPDIVFHLAAQPIVRKSYELPIETFKVNTIGTANLLNAVRKSRNVRVIVNITSDKCYENKEWIWGYKESDRLGGYDPYSCSKACSELITSSFRSSFFREKRIALATARAGNVIGGGDWTEDRIVPDIVRALSVNKLPVIRNPYAIRPWQHVLEPLNGYMLLAEKMWNEEDRYTESWNFGPDDNHIINVSDLVKKLTLLWGDKKDITYTFSNKQQPHEAQILKLDSSKAKFKLGWYQRLSMDQTLNWTINWYKAFYSKNDMKLFSIRQIHEFENLRRDKYDDEKM